MPKITKALGATNADEPVDDGARVDVQEPILPPDADEEAAPAESEEDGAGDGNDGQDDGVTTEDEHAAQDAEARALYEALTVEDLKADLKERELPTTGNKPELVDRLLEDDARQAAAQHEAGGAE
ncbi:SAP domain-containing protein [Amycolatopsis sp., V23-08]|uniref:SAP domain-containing protein n=1 Tax=Amycolatopsis heterodermiae TaxID=3110235 RepID=A0ABU5RIK1_9PSEU|nr:SAP domain-containing protein [Amycolatopsis sp., V23-08]MEA5366097.1 SAP domain-containing protein [Amycolatopsis sp., V23-08]